MAKRYSRDNPFAPAVEPVPRTPYSADNPFARAAASAAPAEPDVSLGQDVADVLRTAVGQGAAMGFGDEVEAAVRAPFSDRTYAEIRDDVRAQNADFGRRHPVLAPSLEVAGAIGSAFVPGLNVAGAAKGATALGRIGRAAATGAALGAVTGIGKDESGTASGTLASAAGGAAGGFLGGVALQGAGEAVRAGWQATQAGARLLDVAEKVAPARSLKEALAQRAEQARARAADRYVGGRLAADGRTPGALARQVGDVHESIPVAVVDLAGENTRQGLAAVKRVPGPAKERVASAVAARDENLPVLMRQSVERNLRPAGPTGTAPANLSDPGAALDAARTTLRETGARLYEPLMERDVQYTPDALENLHRLMQRPSVKRAYRLADELSREADDPIGTLPLMDAPPVFGPDGQPVLPARGAGRGLRAERPSAPALGTPAGGTPGGGGG
jgi:hypothetical protein